MHEPPHSPPAGRWRPRGDVTWCRHGDVVILLSLTTGRYSTLSGTAEAVWRALCEDELPVEAIAPRIAQAAGTRDHARVEQDVAAFVAALQRAALVEPGEKRQAPPASEGSIAALPSESPRRRGLPTVFGTLARLMTVQALLKTVGLRRTVRLVAGPANLPRDARSGHREGEARRAAATVRMVATLYPFRTACLEQSLCVLWILRRMGADARLRLGVVPFPLRAHAWVEHHGVPINEEAEAVTGYRMLPDLLTS